jgi:Tfp pilus assembly protein PilE
MLMHTHATSRGFTIVELIIMIAVIALLASITIFGFGSWRSRTATTEVKGALTNLATSLKSEMNFNSAYPSSVPSTYRPSDGVTITYTMSGGGTAYCARGTSTAVTSVVWYISNTNPTPSQTACM